MFFLVIPKVAVVFDCGFLGCGDNFRIKYERSQKGGHSVS